MTEVAFHFNAPDKRGYTCRLLRKGYMRGARLIVLSEATAIAALDAALWTFASHDFIPHANELDPSNVQNRSPIRIVSQLQADVVNSGEVVLINLTDQVPEGYARFARVIEVVTPAEDDRRWARERWRRYKNDGVDPLRHDLNLAPRP